jgi:hypothetical protein
MCNLKFGRQVPAMRRFAMTQLVQVLEFALPGVIAIATLERIE